MSAKGSHLVLDLDDTLLHTFFISDEQKNEIETNPELSFFKGRAFIKGIVDIRDDNQIGTGNVCLTLIVMRPGFQEFMNYVLEHFDHITFWSAGHFRYVRAIINILVDPNHQKYLDNKIKVLTRQDCNEITKTSVLKDLASKGFDCTRTLILDDNVTTYRNNVENAIPIGGYNPTLKKEHIEYKDNMLQQVIDWFKTYKVPECQDVRKLDKSKIFKK